METVTYQGSGQPAKAIAEYQWFVLWESADPVLMPQVEDALRRIKTLKGR